MRYSIAALALAGAALAAPQGVTSDIAPSASAPDGCSTSYSGKFEITIINVTSSDASKRSLEKRQKSGVLTLTLNDGVLLDQAGRTGYIAKNYQWQFDKPAQTGAIYTAGFSYCSNNTLALGGSAIWYQCLSGGFYNLYDRHWAPQCSPVYFGTIPAGSSGVVASAQSDGQPIPVTQTSDGQPQAPTGAPVTQISDGQPQGTTGSPITQLSDGQPQAPTGAPVTQLSDGQPQGPLPGAPVTQISDGQPQAGTSAAPVTQISDGQPQAPTGAPVTQISDGQPQAPTGAPVTQISDGQPQAPVVTPAPTGSAPNGTNVTSTFSSIYTGAAAPIRLPQYAAAAVGMVGAVVLL